MRCRCSWTRQQKCAQKWSRASLECTLSHLPLHCLCALCNSLAHSGVNAHAILLLSQLGWKMKSLKMRSEWINENCLYGERKVARWANCALWQIARRWRRWIFHVCRARKKCSRKRQDGYALICNSEITKRWAFLSRASCRRPTFGIF